MDGFDTVRLTNLRAEVVAIRLEKSALAHEIASSATTLERKDEAVRRYSILMKKLRATTEELDASR